MSLRGGWGIALAVQSLIAKRSDVHHDADTSVWTWSRPGGPASGIGENTLLARLELIDDRLVVEVNSAGRLARARQWIEALPGVVFERSSTREPLSQTLPVDDRLPAPKPNVTPEMIRMFEQIQRDYTRKWLDESIPMLAGLTPRQACKTADGRRQVERLVRTMPDMGYPGGTIPAPRADLLRELGIV